MKKYLYLVLLVALCASAWKALDVIGFTTQNLLLTIFFFGAQTIVLFRVEDMLGDGKKVLSAILKITIRLLSALVFLLIMIMHGHNIMKVFFVQFIVLYLVFLAFENALALANLRRN